MGLVAAVLGTCLFLAIVWLALRASGTVGGMASRRLWVFALFFPFWGGALHESVAAWAGTLGAGGALPGHVSLLLASTLTGAVLAHVLRSWRAGFIGALAAFAASAAVLNALAIVHKKEIPAVIEGELWVWAVFFWNGGLAAALFAFAFFERRLNLRGALGLCASCGYDVRGVRGNTCPECGERFSDGEKCPRCFTDLRAWRGNKCPMCSLPLSERE